MTTNYPPEIGPNARIMSELAQDLAAWGHHVRVVTAFPNHPTGVIPEAFRRRWYQRESEAGVEVVRSLTIASPRRTLGRRVLTSFFIGLSNLAVSLFRERPDAIVAISP